MTRLSLYLFGLVGWLLLLNMLHAHLWLIAVWCVGYTVMFLFAMGLCNVAGQEH